MRACADAPGPKVFCSLSLSSIDRLDINSLC